MYTYKAGNCARFYEILINTHFFPNRDDCENDLAEAIPALQSAVTSLDTLNAGDITVVKTMKNPAPIVKFVVESVCVMKGVLPDRKPGKISFLHDN